MDNATIAEASAVPSCCVHHDCSRCSLGPRIASARRLASMHHSCSTVECCKICCRFAVASCRMPRPRRVEACAQSGAFSVHVVRADVPNFLPLATLPPRNFDVVLHQSTKARQLFQTMVSGFQCPNAGMDGFYWNFSKRGMVGKLATDKGIVLPMLAMKGKNPCAAAFYFDADMTYHNTFFLSKLIQNSGDNCTGGAAAILCHLIRNSKDRQGEFRPLRLVPADSEISFYESFNCSASSDLYAYYCDIPNPRKCQAYRDDFFDADEYFSDFLGETSSLSDAINFSFVTLVSLFTGISFAVRQACSRASSVGNAPLWAV